MLFSLWVVNREWLNESKKSEMRSCLLCVDFRFHGRVESTAKSQFTPLWCSNAADNFMLDCGSAPTVVGIISGTHLNARNSGKKGHQRCKHFLFRYRIVQAFEELCVLED